MKYIKCVEVWEPNAPVTVDLIHLYDGRIVGITNECIVLYESLSDFEDAQTTERPIIYLQKGANHA